jgi:ABC-type phosphate transport system auxiliary subunit
MSELDNIPQKQTYEIASIKLDDAQYEKLKELNQKSNLIISDFGQIYIRKKELIEELQRLETVLEQSEVTFKDTNAELKVIVDEIDDKYPQARINMADGMVQYQPGAPTRKQLAEKQSTTPQF